MKVVILAGGYGTRLGEITEQIPKPIVSIGGKPILWHIMKTYAHYGYKDFIISLGYKADVIKHYFYNYKSHSSDFTIELGSGDITFHNTNEEADWKVTLVDTGLNSLKGARLKRIERYLDDINMVTYGDGLSDICIPDLLKFHSNKGKIMTISGVHPPARFGELIENDGTLLEFQEKPQTSSGLINGGFMVFDDRLLSYLTPDESCDLEYGVFDTLTAENQIAVFKHSGNWECVDHERDLKHMNQLWNEDKAFWKVW